MNPGATTRPATARVSRAASGSTVTAAIRPSRMPTLRLASRAVSGSSTRPPMRTRSYCSPCAPVPRAASTPSGPHPPASWPGAPAEFRGTSRFRLLRRLGSGGMGIVYAAEDRKRHEVVALKTLLWADAAAVYRLKKEFRSLADVMHPNLVALYELVARDDNWFYTMELIDGVTFLEYLRQSPDRVEGLRALLRQIAAGVAAIHGAGTPP